VFAFSNALWLTIQSEFSVIIGTNSMKTIVAVFLGVSVCFGAEYRFARGQLWNPLNSLDWMLVEGEVERVLEHGVIAHEIKRIYGRSRSYSDSSARVGGFIGGGGGGISVNGPLLGTEAGKRFYIANAPERARVDAYELKLLVMRAGTTNISGSVIEAYEYGRIATDAEVRTEMLARANEGKLRQQAVNESDRAAAVKLVPKVIAYQHQQASNGYPSFQLELGKRYLRGDGVETNLALARHWLQAACTNGESQASNLLAQITK